MHFSEARQGDFPMSVDVLIRALVDVLHHVLLKHEGVVSSHGAGVVVELLVIVANVRLPLGGEKLVHVHLVTQCHHEDDACGETDSRHPTSHQRQGLTFHRDKQPARSSQIQREGFLSFINVQSRGAKNKPDQMGLFSEALPYKMYDQCDFSRLFTLTAMPKEQFLRVLPLSVTFTETWVSAKPALQLADPKSPSQTCLDQQR